MTRIEFICECGERLIDPALALENEAVCAALRSRDYAAVCAGLDNEF